MDEVKDVSDEFEVSCIYSISGAVDYLNLIHKVCGEEICNVQAMKGLEFPCEKCGKKYRLLSVIPLRVEEVR